MRFRAITVGVSLAIILAGCGGGSEDDPAPADEPNGGDSLIDLVRALPEPADSDRLTISFGDVNAIAEANGVPVPTDGDVDSIIEWATSGTTAGAVPVLLPDSVEMSRLAMHDEFEAELGVSLWGTTTFAGVSSPPEKATILMGDHSEDDLTKAMGEPDDGIWAIGPDDGTIDLADATVARPRGESLRLSMFDGDGVALATSGDLLDALLDGGDDTIGADEQFEDVLSALDDPELISGFISRGDLDASESMVNAVAFGTDGQNITARLVLGYPDADEAKEAVAEVEDLLTEGDSLATGSPLSDLFTTDQVEAQGAVVVASLTFSDDQNPGTVVRVITDEMDLPQVRGDN